MQRRPLLLLWPALALVLVGLSLYFGRAHLDRLPRPAFLAPGPSPAATVDSTSPALDKPYVELHDGDHPEESAGEKAEEGQLEEQVEGEMLEEGIIQDDQLNATEIARYIDGILNISSTDLPHLECPAIETIRYEPLLSKPANILNSTIEFFFALDLRNCLPLLPRLIGSIVEAVQFLGPARCALSIVEGNSPDGTGEVLEALRPQLDALTTTYYFKHSDIDPTNITETDRIGALAQLRNLALQPMLNETQKHKFSGNHTTVAFINDVALCPEDILELLFQRRNLEADMVCAMDWTYLGGDPTFYDIWVARTMKGDSFFHIPEGGSFDFAWNLFWNDEETKARYENQTPFQVFSCWNGATAFTAAPIIGDDESRGQVAFRHPDKDECYKGEPQIFCKDLWAHGWNRIAVVPTVHLEYSNERAKQIKELKGYTNALVHANASDDFIDWVSEPPDEVRCMPHLDDQFFEPWNITLA